MKKQNSIIILTMVLAVFSIVSCTKWDEYKQYTANGETSYTGKLDSARISPGRLRVRLQGLLPADPKIVQCKIYWNDGKDSIVFGISKGAGPEVFEKIFNVDEGVKNFKITTFDAAGNSSVVVTTSGSVYGPRYESGLINRPLLGSELLSNGNTVMTWDNFDTTSGAKGTVSEYTTVNNTKATVFTPVSQSTTTLPNFKAGTTVSYKTMYLPSLTAIDTFYCVSQTVGVKYDITNSYILNAGPNFTNSTGGTDRWRTPADWITTADVRNGGNDIGGIDAASWLPSIALSIEAWWGMSAIPNGKIYQTFTLPAGKYAYTATTGDCSNGGVKYFSVAAGTVLPDIGSVTTTALAYKSADRFTDNTISFQLAVPTQVSLGMQGNLPAEGNYMKVFKVRLYSMP